MVELEEDEKESSCSEKSNQSGVNGDDGTLSDNSYSNPNEPECETSNPVGGQTSSNVFSA